MARLTRGNRGHIDGAARVWAEATAFRDGNPAPAPLEDSRLVIAGVAARPGSVLIVALDDDDHVTAFAAAAPAAGSKDSLAGTAEVEYVGVRPDAWGAGLARSVLELLCAELAADGFTRAQLLVYVSNRRAVSIYERLGWQAEGSPKPHRRTGKPEQRYRRTLGEWPQGPADHSDRNCDPPIQLPIFISEFALFCVQVGTGKWDLVDQSVNRGDLLVPVAIMCADSCLRIKDANFRNDAIAFFAPLLTCLTFISAFLLMLAYGLIVGSAPTSGYAELSDYFTWVPFLISLVTGVLAMWETRPEKAKPTRPSRRQNRGRPRRRVPQPRQAQSSHGREEGQ